MLQVLSLVVLSSIREQGESATSIDGGIPLTLGISLWIFAIGFMIMQFLRPRLPYLYYPRLWSKE